MNHWKRLTEFIEKFNSFSYENTEESREFFITFELEMAKALLLDSPEVSIRISKMILALNDINDIKIKIE